MTAVRPTRRYGNWKRRIDLSKPCGDRTMAKPERESSPIGPDAPMNSARSATSRFSYMLDSASCAPRANFAGKPAENRPAGTRFACTHSPLWQGHRYYFAEAQASVLREHSPKDRNLLSRRVFACGSGAGPAGSPAACPLGTLFRLAIPRGDRRPERFRPTRQWTY
jgi:hypothetical protein